ncbi:hypothetical protein B0H16DRAFT_695028 [Mycena metata]|uniref:Uncharacterized protein n=1 Tax=Mycena metata TaxID=1033252 RepID=A0AAD7J3H1_9AGAR|nr:hypothetical protein B0H16DRAFT_695028 [Mycena metata]
MSSRTPSRHEQTKRTFTIFVLFWGLQLPNFAAHSGPRINPSPTQRKLTHQSYTESNFPPTSQFLAHNNLNSICQIFNPPPGDYSLAGTEWHPHRKLQNVPPPGFFAR